MYFFGDKKCKQYYICGYPLLSGAIISICFLGRKDKSISFVICYITKMHLYSFDPLKPHFYIVKLGFSEAVLTSTHNLCFEQQYEKCQNFLSENFPFLVAKFSVYLNRCVFVMKFTYA